MEILLRFNSTVSESKIKSKARSWDKKSIEGAALMKGVTKWAPRCWNMLTVDCRRAFYIIGVCLSNDDFR